MDTLENLKPLLTKLDSEVKQFTAIDKELTAIVVKHGHKDLRSYFLAREKLIRRITISDPNKFKYRRRTAADVERVRKMVLENKKTKDIANTLNLASQTVSNIKKLLRDKGKL